MNKMYCLQWTSRAMLGCLLVLAPCIRAQTPSPAELPSVLLLATDPTALEGTSSGAFTLIRRGPDTNDLDVLLKISGTASNGVDYATIHTNVTIPAGSLAVDILVSPIVDTARRGNKYVNLHIVTSPDYHIGGEWQATVQIIDDVFNIPPPTVAITSPTNGSTFNDPKSITLDAQTSNPGAPVTSVSFYANDMFLGKSTMSPFSLVWTNPQAGHYTLFARAVNQVGESALSAPVDITVTDAVPVVTITSPTNGQNFVVHDNITLKAQASDSDDNIQYVGFYADSHFLGVATNVPYTIVWSNAPPGQFLLRAKAVDQSGDRGYSEPVLINVSRLPGPQAAVIQR